MGHSRIVTIRIEFASDSRKSGYQVVAMKAASGGVV
jgi:hypothetical protein